MKRHPLVLAFVLVAFGALSLAPIVYGQVAPAVALTPEQALRADLQVAHETILQLQVAVAQLKATLADREARLAELTLTPAQDDLRKKRQALDAELVKALGGDLSKGDAFDPASKTLKKATATATAPAAPGKQ